LWATLAGKDAALQGLARQVVVRDGPHITHRVALTDGAEALQQRVLRYCPTFTLILDFIHANEYLWTVANWLFTEQDPQRNAWVESQTLQILSGQTTAVIAEFRHQAQARKTTKAQRMQLERTANYFERNLAQGWPIASGVMEGACRDVVKDRCELAGMRWSQIGAEHLLHLRPVAINGDWDDYHQFRKRQRHGRLYTIPFPQQPGAENQALDTQSLPSDNIIQLDLDTQCQSHLHPPHRIRQAA
jgi:hypothetical protein